MSATETNSRPGRKQLSDQLDRLDTILDALADGLPQAVADATREGARQAVRDVVIELMSNPELRNLIAGVAPPPLATAAPTAVPMKAEPAATPGFWSRLKAECAAAKTAAMARCREAAAAVKAVVRGLSAVMPLRKILLVGAAIGVVVGVVSYVCPHGVAAVASAVGAGCTAIAAQVTRWCRRSARFLGLTGVI